MNRGVDEPGRDGSSETEDRFPLRQRFTDAVRLLSMPAEAQLADLRSQGRVESIDELALGLDDVLAATLASGELSEAEARMARDLDTRLAAMSGEANAGLWSAAALSRAAEWREVRRLASELLGWLERTPR